MSKTASISRFRTSGGWRIQLIGYSHGDISAWIYAEVDIPDDQAVLGLADDFIYAVADVKALEIKPRRGDDS